MRLTVKERILLHLLESARAADEVEVSTGLTQEGLACGAGIERRHVVQFVRPLIRDEFVEERTAHVVGKRQRMKVYALTSAGHAAAIRLRETLKSQVVKIRDGGAVRQGSLREALEGLGMKASLLQIVRGMEQVGMLDLETVRHPPEPSLVEQTWDAPQIGAFVGRRKELEEVTSEATGPRIFVVRGIAGIGKSYFAAKACELVRGRRSLFWHRIRPWETSQTVLASLGRFLEALDRPGLVSVLKRGESGLAAEVLRQDLPDTHAVLVFDDAHEATAETLTLFRMLTEAVASAPDVTVLVLTRQALSFYDVREVSLKRLVREIELGGLKPEEAVALLAQSGDSANLAGLGRRLAGHPLLIELVRYHRSDAPRAIQDVQRFIEEAVYRDLSAAEKATMKAASLYRVPIPQQTLLSIPECSYDVLIALQDRSLVRDVGGGRYEVHDTISDFFEGVLTPEESRRFGALAVAELRALAAKGFASGDFVSSINCLSNAIQLPLDSREREGICEGLGDAEERIGDLPAALVSYKEAIRLATVPGSAARLHRKIAAALQARGEVPSASAEVEAAFKALRDANDVERGWLNLVRSRMSIAKETWSEGREDAEAALETFRHFHDGSGQAEALLELASIQINSPRGNPDSAYRYLREALRLSESVANPWLAASVHTQFANLCAYRLRNAKQAMVHLDAVAASPGAHADFRRRQSLLILKGWFNLDFRGDFETAYASFVDSLTLAKKTHDPVTAAMARYGAAVATFHAGDFAVARRELEEAASELLDRGYAGFSVEALWVAAEICIVTEDFEGFRRIAARIEDPVLARGVEVRPVLVRALKGMECLLNGDRRGTRAAFRDAIQLARHQVSPQEWPLVPFTHDYYSMALDAMGEHREAAEHRRQAVRTWRRFGLEGRLALRAKLAARITDSLTRAFESSLSTTAAR